MDEEFKDSRLEALALSIPLVGRKFLSTLAAAFDYQGKISEEEIKKGSKAMAREMRKGIFSPAVTRGLNAEERNEFCRA